MNKPVLIGLLLTGMLLCTCSMNPVAGGSSQQGNGTVIGYAVYQGTGLPAKEAAVRLRRADYYTNITIPANETHYWMRNGHTDNNGKFTFTNIDTGSYCIEITDDTSESAITSNAAFVRCRITPTDTTISFTTIILKTTGSITGEFASISDTMNTTDLLLYGIERKAIILTATRQFIYNNVPEGTYTMCVVKGESSFAPQGADSVSVTSDAVTNAGIIDMLPFHTWKHSRQIFLNTTANGADVSESVKDFPVLVRLTSTVFNFTEAQVNGEDIRFTKSDGITPLTCEIEQWDAGAQQAALWVKFDTVYGNNNTQSIMMFWGNQGATAVENSAAVFDTATGFAGVWHLGESGSVAAQDATSNGYDGTKTATAQVAGAVGNGQAFDDTLSMIQMAGTTGSRLNFPKNGNYTISAWAYPDSIDGFYHVVAAKGHEQYFTKLKYDGLWEFVEWLDGEGAEMTWSTTAATKAWSYITGVRQGTSQYIYVNGALIDSTIELATSPLPRDESQDFSIGRYIQSYPPEGYACFKGKLDEVRASGAVRGPDWIKLCYMNQKADDALVEFR